MAASDDRYYRKTRNDITRWPIKLLSNIRRRCKLADIPCTLAVDDIVIPEPCPVLGIRFSSDRLRGKRNASPPSVHPGEFLHAATVARFTRVYVALGVYREIVKRTEFTSVAAVAGEASERLTVAPRQDVDLAFLPVRDIDVLLRRVWREQQIFRV